MNRKNVITKFVSVSFCLLPLFVPGQSAKQTIIFHNLDKKKGSIYIAWYNKEEDFAKEDKIHLSKVVDVSGKNTEAVTFENVMPGMYAVAAFFDQNGNGKMDTNIFGIPREKYGFSNNARPLMRAATFKEAAFMVTNKENVIYIKLK